MMIERIFPILWSLASRSGVILKGYSDSSRVERPRTVRRSQIGRGLELVCEHHPVTKTMIYGLILLIPGLVIGHTTILLRGDMFLGEYIASVFSSILFLALFLFVAGMRTRIEVSDDTLKVSRFRGVEGKEVKLGSIKAIYSARGHRGGSLNMLTSSEERVLLATFVDLSEADYCARELQEFVV